MKAARVLRLGPSNVITNDDLPSAGTRRRAIAGPRKGGRGWAHDPAAVLQLEIDKGGADDG
jgi:hypothetical protein